MKAVYLDYNATTPLDPRVLEKMLPYFQEHFGNAASSNHQWGWAAESAVKKSRQQIAQLIGAKEQEIYFTSGATEANNLAILGLIEKIRSEDPQAPIHMISTQVEHESVKKTLEYAQNFLNVQIDFLPVNSEGRVSPNEVRKSIKPQTRLISVIWVQNEIGTIQPVDEIAQIAKDHKIYFHTDATQAVGKISVDVDLSKIDMLSGSAHKFYGPKGVGFLYVRSQNPKVQLLPLFWGGGQEKNLRSGTSNVPGIVGLGAAAEICLQNFDSEYSKTKELRDLLWTSIQYEFPQAQLNGSLSFRSPVNLNILFHHCNLNLLTPYFPQLAMSAGSACHSGTWTHSYVLKALGLSEEASGQSLRLSLGRFTTREDIQQAVHILKKALKNQ